jgi:hypothetical protein
MKDRAMRDAFPTSAGEADKKMERSTEQIRGEPR